MQQWRNLSPRNLTVVTLDWQKITLAIRINLLLPFYSMVLTFYLWLFSKNLNWKTVTQHGVIISPKIFHLLLKHFQPVWYVFYKYHLRVVAIFAKYIHFSFRVSRNFLGNHNLTLVCWKQTVSQPLLFSK